MPEEIGEWLQPEQPEPAPGPAVQIDGRGTVEKITNSHVAAVYERTPAPGRKPLRPLTMTHRHCTTSSAVYALHTCCGYAKDGVHLFQV